MPTVTILVTDLVGSTELRARIGDEHAERLRRVHDRLTRAAVETHGGIVVKGLGDGVLARFAEASAGLASAVAIQQGADAHTHQNPDLPLVLRVGLSAGDVTVDGGDCFGTPVVEAARLCGTASGGQILAAEVVRLLVKGRGGHLFKSAGERQLKGLPDPVVAVKVGWERDRETAELPFPKLLSAEGELGFAGRAAELEVLSAAWKQAAAGERHGVLVGGEPGVGKTRLAAELARSVHRGGAAVLYGRCHEDLGVPYEPFVEALTFFCETAPLVAGRSSSRGLGGDGSAMRTRPVLRDLLDDNHAVLDHDEEGHDEWRAGNVGEHELVLTEHSDRFLGRPMERPGYDPFQIGHETVRRVAGPLRPSVENLPRCVNAPLPRRH